MNCKHPTLYVLGPENKPAPYGYCMLCEVARLTADIATLERRERSRNNRIAELEDALPALDARKEGDAQDCPRTRAVMDRISRFGYSAANEQVTTLCWELERELQAHLSRQGVCKCPPNTRCWSDCGEKQSPASRDGRKGELAQAIAERNELRKDAARYWFLRSVPEPKVREVVGWLQWLSKEAFDAAIDEAIATAQKEHWASVVLRNNQESVR